MHKLYLEKLAIQMSKLMDNKKKIVVYLILPMMQIAN